MNVKKRGDIVFVFEIIANTM